ncbi:MAG TPA: carboxypeptidase regulatory-like domain-containing protein [Thermoanaerobaculia bacterium]|nr:carboxypeptidase regulatory-like domain-containing protein [Thermoanaerobaculia bacterium]
MRFSIRSFAIAALMILIAASTFAQATSATLTGTITTGGSPLPGATITVSSPALLGMRTAVTGNNGDYNVPALPPGDYTIKIQLEGMSPVTKKARLALAETTHIDADLKVSTVTEAITVTAGSLAVMESPEIATNYTKAMMEKLPVPRTILSAVTLAPAAVANANAFNGQIAISGAPSYDNVYLLNGTVLNENLRGQPDSLFIEDAIQETTVMTGGISAEYGRFTGGVISTITKSGGNEFSGSFRDNLSNAKWTAKTPFPTEADHVDTLNNVYEETLGGYLLKDRLWFFGAARQSKTSTQNFTTLTNLPFVAARDQKRIEGKLTGQITQKHNITASYVDVKDQDGGNFFGSIMDTRSLNDRLLPNKLATAQYNGVLASNLLLTANYSNKKFSFVNAGAKSTDIIDGTLMVDNPSGRRYWSPTFCGVCGPEERNNYDWTGKASYFMPTKSMGSHNLVAGVDRFSETRLVNNHQSGSDFRILGNTKIVGTTVYPVLDSTSIIQWNPIFFTATGDHLSVKSAFVNDRWDYNTRFSFNVGLRFDKNNAQDDSGNVVSKDSALSPRLGLQFDLRGDGKHKFNANYGRYVSKIEDGNVGGGANANGNPSTITWFYRGPSINPSGTADSALLTTDKALAALWNWFNSVGGTSNSSNLRSVSISGLSTVLQSPLVSPYVDEFTAGYGVQMQANAYLRFDLVKRDWHDFYAAQLVKTNPTVVDPFGNKGDVQFLVNDNLTKRTYRAIQLQGQWKPTAASYTGLTYAYSRLRGNDQGESAGSATVPNQPLALYYPEYLGYANRLPTGVLPEDTPHKLRLWAGYDFRIGHVGTLSASLLQAYESGAPYSVSSTIDATGRTAGTSYTGLPVNPGYTLSQIGTSHTYFFSGRGALRADPLNRTDATMVYEVPITRFSFRLQGTVTNVFNKHALINPDTTVFTRRTSSTRGLKAFNPFTDTPIECPRQSSFASAAAAVAACTAMGANYQKADTFGQAIGVSSYQTPRTYSFAAGLRF